MQRLIQFYWPIEKHFVNVLLELKLTNFNNVAGAEEQFLLNVF